MKKRRFSTPKTTEQKPDDRKYFEEIYRDYFDRLFSYALVITRSEALAKDVVSDVFFQLFSSRMDLRSIKELKSYLFTCTKNKAVRMLADNPLRFQIEDFNFITGSIDRVSPEDLLVGQELDDFLKSVIRKLPAQCALVFEFIREKGMKYEEASVELGISVETVRYHIKTALSKIRVELQDRYNDAHTIDWYRAG